jgi:hypothetical protein
MPQLCAAAYGCLDGMWLPTPGYCCLSSITYIGDSRYLDMISNNAVIINAHLCSHSEQYNIQPHNCYNMDEKGFLIGYLQKVRRIFPKALMEKQKLLGTSQDGSREWITLLATICADGSSLPPALIYKAVSGDLQDSWLQDYDLDKHPC